MLLFILLCGDAAYCFGTATAVNEGQTFRDLTALYDGLGAGRRAAQALGPVHAIAIDSWGVNFGLIDAEGRGLAPPLHYRNGRGSEGVARGVQLIH